MNLILGDLGVILGLSGSIAGVVALVLGLLRLARYTRFVSYSVMTGFLSDADFTDLLRLCQVALHRGDVDPGKVKQLGVQIAEEFPAGDHRMNHELIRLAVRAVLTNPDNLYGAAFQMMGKPCSRC